MVVGVGFNLRLAWEEKYNLTQQSVSQGRDVRGQM